MAVTMDRVQLLLSPEDDERFNFNVDDIVFVEKTAGGSQAGTIARIINRRNGYPKPFFDCWFPVLFLKHLDGTPGGGEIHEDCVRAATQEEIRAIMGE